MFKTELSEQEINFIVSVLDKIQLSGLQNQNMCLGIANKLAQLLQAVAPAEVPAPTEEKIEKTVDGNVGLAPKQDDVKQKLKVKK